MPQRTESFAALLAAINRLAHEVDLALDVAVDLLTALDDYAKEQAVAATAAERERCAQVAERQQELRSGPAIAALLRDQPAMPEGST
jgi:hypothetical protein